MWKRKLYIFGLSLVIVFGCVFLIGQSVLHGADKPNIVFLFTDDQSVPHLGAYGNPVIHTPNIDRMAEEGVLFERAYVPTSQCSPTRAALLTGRVPHEVGASRLHVDVQDDFLSTTLVRLLKDEEYYTGAFRKVHHNNIKSQFDFYGGGDAPIPSFFDKLPEDQPFFLWFGTRDPHRPYNPEQYEYHHDPEKVIVPDFLPDTKAVRKDIANYYNEITRFDREAGQIMKLLNQHGLAENTMIVMTSDNGMPFPRAKAYLYEAGIHVPLIVKWPGNIEGGKNVGALVSLIDLVPTWLKAADIPVPPKMQGQSLLPLLKGKQTNHREYVFAERNWHDNWDPMRAVVGERYKLILNYRPGAGTVHTLDRLYSPTWDEFERLKKEGKLKDRLNYYFASSKPFVEFYDLKKDPGEWNNLAGNSEYDSLLNKYKQVLSDWMNETHDFLPPPKEAFPSRIYNENYDVLDAEEFD